MTEADVGERGITLRTSTDVLTLATEIVKSGMCPKAYAGKPKEAMIAMLAGRAVGLEPLQALAGIAVIGGRPSMFGDARAAVVLGSGLVGEIDEWFELDGKRVEPQYAKLADYPDGLTACWRAKRKDQSEPTPVVRFSVGDAKVARLWAKTGPWTDYPTRMLHMRARAWGERDHFADALHGIQQVEEVQDIERPKPKWEQAIEGEIVPAPVQAGPPDDDAKRAAFHAVKDYLQCEAVAEPLDAGDLILAVLKDRTGKGTAETQGELDAAVAAILKGAYDLETGNLIPPAEEPDNAAD